MDRSCLRQKYLACGSASGCRAASSGSGAPKQERTSASPSGGYATARPKGCNGSWPLPAAGRFTMSTPSFDSGDPLAVKVDGHPHLPEPRSNLGAGAGVGRHVRTAGAHRVTAARLPQELDYRLRGLGVGPTEDVPTPPTRADNAPAR